MNLHTGPPSPRRWRRVRVITTMSAVFRLDRQVVRGYILGEKWERGKLCVRFMAAVALRARVLADKIIDDFGNSSASQI